VLYVIGNCIYSSVASSSATKRIRKQYPRQIAENKYAAARFVLSQEITISLDGGREGNMSEVRVKENESLDSALRRFKRNCAKAGIMGEVRKREHYDKPSVKRKKKSEAARKRKF